MTAPDARALALFEEALGRDRAEWPDWLARACGDDHALRDQVQRLLAADGASHPLLDRPPGALLADMDTLRRTWEGERLGPYRVVREVGRGGMGLVFLAERGDVGARVALKLFAGNLSTPERLARFDYERRVLAALDDPHIARFLDAGVAADGTPWYAMEFVDGSPIDVHADARCLSVRERVRLLESAANAVAHAHRNLLVHRDLKPSNVLVSDAGVPKLVDFGIAKLLGATPEDGALTADAMRGPMTPEYASPEQVRGDVITTASDVYQLGIVLHELVTGRRPTRRNGEPLRHFDRAAGLPMLRPSELVVLEVQPHQLPGGLSTRTARELAALRGATPAQLRRQLAGDLDRILEVALDPDPSRRYASALEFAEDLRRFRLGHAVTARAASLGYRARKFVRRHAFASAMALGLVAVLVTATATLHQQRHRIALERDRAQEVARVLERLVRYAAPGPQSNDSAAVRTILAGVTADGLAGLRTEPEMWARILEPVADIYAATVSPDSAMMIWRAIIGALERRVPRDDPVLVDALASLGVRMVEHGDFRGGLAMLERMLAHSRGMPDERRAQFAGSLSFAAYGRQVAGDDSGAKRLYEETLALAATLPDSAGRTWDRTLLNLGYLVAREGDVDSAVVLLRHSLQRRVSRDGPSNPGTVNAMAALARHLLQRDAAREAEPLVDSVLAVRRRTFVPPHALLAEAAELKAMLLLELGRAAEAEPFAREALEMYRGVYGDRHFLVAYAQANLASTIAGQGALPRAIELQRRAVSHYRRASGDRHPGTVAAIVQLARLESLRGRDDEAERLLAEAIGTLDAIAPGKPALARPLADLGALLARGGRCPRAEPYLRRALSVARHGRDSADAMASLRACGAP